MIFFSISASFSFFILFIIDRFSFLLDLSRQKFHLHRNCFAHANQVSSPMILWQVKWMIPPTTINRLFTHGRFLKSVILSFLPFSQSFYKQNFSSWTCPLPGELAPNKGQKSLVLKEGPPPLFGLQPISPRRSRSSTTTSTIAPDDLTTCFFANAATMVPLPVDMSQNDLSQW